MPRRDYWLGLGALASPYLIGAGFIAYWSPAGGVLVGLGALVGLAWVLAMGRAAKDN